MCCKHFKIFTKKTVDPLLKQVTNRPITDCAKYKAVVLYRKNKTSKICHEFLGPKLFNLLPINIREIFYYNTDLKYFHFILQFISKSNENLIKLAINVVK